ncbi:PulJ/GspJ family protein [Vibrio metschnikovii]|uniref:PulJ/GspJ family protein n=1 Tax=Vibrio metschnikovii TaxID=28172 RepID=UPI001C30F519|nr:prepilin-type N-terminal cleavage/methylation domain-containing protein [Vibrio metschnikovii]
MTNNQKGFTLIEVLVALVIFSSVVSIALFGFEQGKNAWQRSLSQSQIVEREYARYLWLNNLFNQAVASNFSYGYADSNPFFEGDEKTVSFLSESPIISGPGTYAWVQIGYRIDDDNEMNIIFSETPNADPYWGLYTSQFSRSLILFDNIADFHFSYLMEKSVMSPRGIMVRGEREWVNRYDSRNSKSLPVMVKLTVMTKSGRSFDWFFKIPNQSRAGDSGSQLEIS